LQVSINKTEVTGNMKVEWGSRVDPKAITNVVIFKRPDMSHIDLQYTLFTPYYSEDTVVAKFSGLCPEDVWNITSFIKVPRSNQLASAELSYQALDNVNGTISSQTPFKKLPRASAHFEIVSRR